MHADQANVYSRDVMRTEPHRHHLFDTVLQKVLRMADRLRIAGSACANAPLSVKTWRHQPNSLLSVCHSQLHQHLPDKLPYLEWVTCIMHAYDGRFA